MAEITLLTYWKVFKKRKRFLFIITVLSAAAAGFMALSAPREYTASASVFPPAESVDFIGALGKAGLPVSTGGSPTSIDSLRYLIKTRRMAEGIVEHFNLTERFGTSKENAIRRARRMLDSYDIARGTIFVIEATTGKPEFSAELANFCVAYLNKINEDLDLTSAKPLLKVIDQARAPTVHNSRNTMKKVLTAILFSAISSYFLFFMAEYFRMLREEERRKTVSEDAEKLLKEFDRREAKT
ncbi:MAG: Wzz/FepE/Etk N-terminal domain-containing protein [Candidatus Omnitrophota bacterium]